MAIVLNFVVKTTLILLVLGGFFCVFSHSETICNLPSCYKFCTRVAEELHFFLSQSELSNFFVYIINMKITFSSQWREKRFFLTTNMAFVTSRRTSNCLHVLFTSKNPPKLPWYSRSWNPSTERPER